MKNSVYNAPTDTNRFNPKVWDSHRKANAIQLWQLRITLKLIMCLITHRPNIEMLEAITISSTCQMCAHKSTNARSENEDARKNTREINCICPEILRFKLELIMRRNMKRPSVFSVLIRNRPDSMITLRYGKSRCVRVHFPHLQAPKTLITNIKQRIEK